MITKVVTMLKYVGLFSFVFFGIISCQDQIENIGVDLVENNKFTTHNFESYAHDSNTEDIERVPANGVQQYLLGVYNDPEFGELKGSVVSQILLASTGANYDYGDNAAIDSVIINIPYQVTKQDDTEEGKPVFEIDSIFGNSDQEFKLSVYELETFFNSLDPEDPSKPMIYYSDKVFEKPTTPFYSEDFKINPNDTVGYIKRYLADGITVYDTDTIKESDSSPTIKLPLNEAMIQEIFVDNASGPEFSSLDNFIHYFRGFYLEATELATNNAHLISLNMTKAKMTIYYSNNEDEGDEQDLNGNGVNGEKNVRVKHLYTFLFSPNNKSNVLERDYSNSKQSGSERLYVQGAAGSEATIDLFSEIDLLQLQEDQLLITGANLTLFVDPNADSDILPEQLFIYNYDENEQIIDMMTEGIASVGGLLVRDEDGNPEKYVFRIVDYISEILKEQDPENWNKVGIKVFNPSDAPQTTADTAIKEYSWVPNGVVLFDQSESAGDKRVKLEIFYSKVNN